MALRNPETAALAKAFDEKLAALEARLAQEIAAVAVGGGGLGCGLDPSGVDSHVQADATVAQPFMVFWNVGEKKWDIYLPEGSLYVAGKKVSVEKPSPLPVMKGYLHINTKKNPAEAKITANSTESGYDYSCQIYELENIRGGLSVLKYQFISGAMHIVNSFPPSVFDPKYDDNGHITGVERPYIMCGRKVVTATGTPVNGVNVVKVSHSSDTVTATITTGSATPANSSTSETIIPLYKIENYAIVEDYRSMPCVPLYDPKS